MNHTPPIPQTTEEYSDVVSRHILCALRMYDNKDDKQADLETYYNYNHTISDRLAKAWVACKGDSNESYARCLCYGNIGFKYDLNNFIKIPELHYEQMQEYWHNVVRYTQRSLSGLI